MELWTVYFTNMKLVDIGQDARWKLSPFEHKEIRKLYYKEDIGSEEIGFYYGVTGRQVRKIVDLSGTAKVLVKNDATKNQIRYETSPKYRKLLSASKKATYYKRKKLGI